MDQSGFDLASIHSAASGEDESFGSRASDWVTQGIPAALGSGLISMYNTGVALGNVLGADADKIDTGAALASFDDNVGNYYANHQQGADLGGFLLTSLAPGLIGIKALKMLQGGTAGVNAARVVGALKTTAPLEPPSFLANPLAYAARQEAFFTAKSLDKIRLGANEIYSALDKDKLAAIAAGMADQALQGAAFESAVLLTMNQSPIISKEDEGYFTSLAGNLWQVPVAGVTQGLIGGVLGGLGKIGQFSSFKKSVDTEQFSSVHSQRVGASELAAQPGTLLAANFSYLDNFNRLFAEGKAAGTLTDAQITNFTRTAKNFSNELRASLTKELLGNDNAGINDGLWNLIIKSEKPAETANIILAGAKRIERIGTDVESLGADAPKVFFGGGQLPFRKAENMLKRTDKIFPDVLENPEPALLDGLTTQGFELWRDTGGVYHVLEDSKYARDILPKDVSPVNVKMIVKLTGEDAGTATTTAFPVVGDISKNVSLSRNEADLLLDGRAYSLPKTFDPLTNEPIDANAQFVYNQLRDLKRLASEETGDLFIKQGDIPLLEAAAKKGFDGDVFYGENPVTSDLVGTLHQEKIDMRQELIQAGHGFDRIARELNVTKNWAETGRGDGFLLAEDHTVPIHAKISYETGFLPDGHYIRGIADLQSLVNLGKNMNETVAASILGDAYNRLPSTHGALFDVTTLPESANLVRSTSGDYGTTLSYFQQSGKVVHEVVRERAQGTFQSLQAAEFQLKASKDAILEGNIVLNRFRSSKEPLFKWVDEQGTHFVPEKIYKKLQTALKNNDAELVSTLLSDKSVWQIQNKAVEEYFLANAARESVRANEWNQIFAAKGSSQHYNPDRIHVPPIDTTKYSHVNFIKEKMDVPGRAKEAGVVVANSADELAAKVDRLKAAYGDRFEIYTASDIKLYKQAQGEWETGPMLGDSLTDQAMRSEGLLYEFQPRVDTEFINDFNNWHWRQENNIVRNTIELKYAQEFAELRAMARRFDDSKFGPKGTSANKNPYYNYIKTALDVSNFDRYNSIWGKFNDVVERTGSSMVDVWQNAFHQAKTGDVDWVKANEVAKTYGFTPPYEGAIASIVQPLLPHSRAIEPAIAKINGAVSTLTLGFDFLNSLINVISFPIMGISEMHNLLRQVGNRPEILAAIKDATSVAIPESKGLMLPTPMKLLTNSMKRLFNDKGELLTYYKAIGAVRDPRGLGFDVINAATMTPDAISSLEKFSTFANTTVAKAAEYGRTITGSNKAETWVRFMAADMMKQITDIAKIPASDAPAYINSFVNRVHGNYLANQRPHLFQGVVGQAISLFQTYQFNLMQNMVRYVGQGDKTAAAMLLGLQNTIFGIQGNPAFYLLNQAVGNSNPEHIDIISGSRMLVGQELSDWMIYGLGANAIQTALYNRGDLTPRYVTVVPTQISDIPAISIPYKAIGAFVQSASAIAKGANTQDAILNGVAHFGANRPIAGLAQLAQGFRTSSKGDLITAYNDINGFTVAAKIAGGEELNRGIAMDAYYRNLAYKTYDEEKKKALGQVVKTTMYAGRNPTEDQVVQFMHEYTRAGGAPQSFNRWMQTEFKHASQSQMNVLKAHVNSPAGRLQATMMGADTQDYWYNPPASRATTGEE